ncbi:MAG: hypothetical protein ABI627_09595 [Polyangiaceae bacterium]
MTEFDPLLSRLRELPPIAPDAAFSASVQRLGQRRLRGPVRRAPFASLAVAATVVAYLGWALNFAGALYR